MTATELATPNAFGILNALGFILSLIVLLGLNTRADRNTAALTYSLVIGCASFVGMLTFPLIYVGSSGETSSFVAGNTVVASALFVTILACIVHVPRIHPAIQCMVLKCILVIPLLQAVGKVGCYCESCCTGVIPGWEFLEARFL